MRILYGVVGEGMGHAMRSRVILDHLVKDHQVQVVVSGRAYDYLKRRFADTTEVKKIWGYSLVYEDNEVQNFKTLLENVKGAVKGWPENVRAYFDLAERFEPDVVISDFESWSYLFGKSHRIPILSVDNMQIIDRCQHAPEILEGKTADFALTKAIVKAKVAGALHYYITTFFYPPLRKPENTSLHPPVLRPEILAAGSAAAGASDARDADDGEHLLVYQTSTSNEGLPAILKRCGLECRIYGLRRDLTEDLRDGNLLYRPFSEAGFIDDLRTARGVVAGGGFTLMGEAVYLRRPMLSIPVRKQFEQVLNARYLQAAGYGLGCEELTDQALGQFIEGLPDFRAHLAGYQQDGNSDLLGALDQGLTNAATAPR